MNPTRIGIEHFKHLHVKGNRLRMNYCDCQWYCYWSVSNNQISFTFDEKRLVVCSEHVPTPVLFAACRKKKKKKKKTLERFSAFAVFGFRGVYNRLLFGTVLIRFGFVSVCVLTFTDWFRVSPEPWGSDREVIVMCLLDYLGKGAKSNQGFSCKWLSGTVL